MSSNARDGPMIHLCREYDEASTTSKLMDKNSGTAAKVDFDRGDSFTRGFYEIDTDCNVDSSTSDVNQLSYKDLQPAKILKPAKV